MQTAHPATSTTTPTTTIWRPLAWGAAAAAMALMLAIALAKWRFGIPVRYFTTEPTTAAQELWGTVELTPATGFVSQLGLMAWSMAAGIYLLGAVVRGQVNPVSGVLAGMDRFLAMGALLTLWLVIDDAFMVHDAVGPRLGVGELPFHAITLLGTAAWLWLFRASIRSGPWRILLAALVFLGMSLAVDQFFEVVLPHTVDADWESLIEDGFKLVGVLLWACYAAAETSFSLTQRRE